MIGKIKDICRRTSTYCTMYGKRALISKVTKKLFAKQEISYEEWLKKHELRKAELRKQSKASFPIEPFMSVLVVGAERAILTESIKVQTYAKAEMVCYNPKVPMIEQVRGAYILCVDHRAVLMPNALFEIVKKINEAPETELLYFDEDYLDLAGNKRQEPHFKSGYNPDMLRSTNYIGNVFCVKRNLLERMESKPLAFDGVQDYAFLLSCTENTKEISGIQKILFSMTEEKPLGDGKAVVKVLEKHYDNFGIAAKVEESCIKGIYHTRYLLEEEPMVSIIIANKDHVEDLRKCVESVEARNTYSNYEVLIVENNSTEEETFAYYKELESRYENVRILYWKEAGFNYSLINNFGAKEAKGEYLLFLNNDTEVISPDWMKELLGCASRKEVGAVGARLYYEDGTLQHAGVLVGYGGVAGHVFAGAKATDPGYQNRICMSQNYSVVTAACMMVPRKVFEEAGGFDTGYAVAFNDVDFCLKLRKAGYLIVYNPWAELSHYEYKSRGAEDTKEKQSRFLSEVMRFRERWSDILEKGDPYYNSNLTLDKHDFSLKV